MTWQGMREIIPPDPYTEPLCLTQDRRRSRKGMRRIGERGGKGEKRFLKKSRKQENHFCHLIINRCML